MEKTQEKSEGGSISLANALTQKVGRKLFRDLLQKEEEWPEM